MSTNYEVEIDITDEHVQLTNDYLELDPGDTVTFKHKGNNVTIENLDGLFDAIELKAQEAKFQVTKSRKTREWYPYRVCQIGTDICTADLRPPIIRIKKENDGDGSTDDGRP